MRRVRIYQQAVYEVGKTYALTSQAGHHLVTVLRLSKGTAIELFNGHQYQYQALITAIAKKHVEVLIESATYLSRESSCHLHLAQALSKGDRMEWVVQKAVELGVVSITPILSERAVVRLDKERAEKKIKQWQAIAIGACEQSGRNIIPTIFPIIALSDYLSQCHHALKLVLSPTGQYTWRDLTPTQTDIALLIGPEGGINQQELEQAIAHQFLPLTLGPRILRTETAAITALSVLQATYGDL